MNITHYHIIQINNTYSDKEFTKKNVYEQKLILYKYHIHHTRHL